MQCRIWFPLFLFICLSPLRKKKATFDDTFSMPAALSTSWINSEKNKARSWSVIFSLVFPLRNTWTIATSLWLQRSKVIKCCTKKSRKDLGRMKLWIFAFGHNGQKQFSLTQLLHWKGRLLFEFPQIGCAPFLNLSDNACYPRSASSSFVSEVPVTPLPMCQFIFQKGRHIHVLLNIYHQRSYGQKE